MWWCSSSRMTAPIVPKPIAYITLILVIGFSVTVLSLLSWTLDESQPDPSLSTSDCTLSEDLHQSRQSSTVSDIIPDTDVDNDLRTLREPTRAVGDEPVRRRSSDNSPSKTVVEAPPSTRVNSSVNQTPHSLKRDESNNLEKDDFDHVQSQHVVLDQVDQNDSTSSTSMIRVSTEEWSADVAESLETLALSEHDPCDRRDDSDLDVSETVGGNTYLIFATELVPVLDVSDSESDYSETEHVHHTKDVVEIGTGQDVPSSTVRPDSTPLSRIGSTASSITEADSDHDSALNELSTLDVSAVMFEAHPYEDVISNEAPVVDVSSGRRSAGLFIRFTQRSKKIPSLTTRPWRRQKRSNPIVDDNHEIVSAVRTPIPGHAGPRSLLFALRLHPAWQAIVSAVQDPYLDPTRLESFSFALRIESSRFAPTVVSAACAIVRFPSPGPGVPALPYPDDHQLFAFLGRELVESARKLCETSRHKLNVDDLFRHVQDLRRTLSQWAPVWRPFSDLGRQLEWASIALHDAVFNLYERLYEIERELNHYCRYNQINEEGARFLYFRVSPYVDQYGEFQTRINAPGGFWIPSHPEVNWEPPFETAPLDLTLLDLDPSRRRTVVQDTPRVPVRSKDVEELLPLRMVRLPSQSLFQNRLWNILNDKALTIGSSTHDLNKIRPKHLTRSST